MVSSSDRCIFGAWMNPAASGLPAGSLTRLLQELRSLLSCSKEPSNPEDLKYIDTRSPLLDLMVLLKTVRERMLYIP
jgi:hypothetical protein